jgi:hypothetical protein
MSKAMENQGTFDHMNGQIKEAKGENVEAKKKFEDALINNPERNYIEDIKRVEKKLEEESK